MTRFPNTPGFGLRLPHLAEMVATRPPAGWLEVHPENIVASPHAAELLTDLAADYPISLHTVGISIGSAIGIDRSHLKRIRALADRIDPVFVSGHLAWSTYENEYLNDLLPLPYNEETLQLVHFTTRNARFSPTRNERIQRSPCRRFSEESAEITRSH